jgi:hypothetical protein
LIWKKKRKRIGIFQIWEVNKYTREKKIIDEVNNLLMNDCLDREIQIFEGVAPDAWIKYLGVGDDNTAVTTSDTVLGNERIRTYFTSQSKTGTGELTTDFYLNDSEANFEIEELGIFAGNLATSTADTGNLLSHVLWNYTKTSSVEILVRRVDSVS